MYQSMFLGQSGMLGVKELWKVKALPTTSLYGLQSKTAAGSWTVRAL
jgi:hypothetical protein